MPEPISAPAACTPPGDSPPVLGFVRSRSPRFRHSSASLSSGRSGSALAGNVRCCLPTRPCFRSSVSRRVPADTVLSGRDSAPLHSPERRGPCPWPGFPGSLLHRKWRANTHTKPWPYPLFARFPWFWGGVHCGEFCCTSVSSLVPICAHSAERRQSQALLKLLASYVSFSGSIIEGNIPSSVGSGGRVALRLGEECSRHTRIHCLRQLTCS